MAGKKKNPDLYSALGVGRDADGASIDKAFKQRAHETHPDKGGIRAEFELVRLAHNTLRDPAKRRHYDETGDITKDTPDNHVPQVLGIVSEVLQAVIAKLATDGQDFTTCDMIGSMRQTIDNTLKALAKEKTGRADAVKNLKRIKGRFTHSETKGANFLEGLIDQQIAGIDEMIQSAEQREKLVREALAYLEKYQFRFDTVQRHFGTATSTSSATFTVGGW